MPSPARRIGTIRYSASMRRAGAPRIDGRVDTRHRDGRVAKGLVGDKARDLSGEPQEVGIGRVDIAQLANLVRDDGVLNDEQRIHVVTLRRAYAR